MKFWPRQENLNWWEFALTIVITLIIAVELGIAIYGLRESKAQGDLLRDLKTDTERAGRLNERPWLNVSVGQGRLIDGQPLLMPIQLVNSGKTPAKIVAGVVVVNLLRKGQEPAFVYETGHARYAIDAGTAAPNFPSNFLWAALPEDVPPNEKLMPIIVTPSLRRAIAEGNLYIVVHGRVTYRDIFGIEHWLTFCSYAENAPMLIGPNASKCAHYNDVDKNN